MTGCKRIDPMSAMNSVLLATLAGLLTSSTSSRPHYFRPGFLSAFPHRFSSAPDAAALSSF